MKQFISALCVLGLIFAPLPPPVFAQQLNQAAASLNASSASCATPGSCVVINLGTTDRTVTIGINGTFVGTQTFEASNSGGAQWSSISCPTWNYGATVSSATATGSWVCDVSGRTNLRVRTSAYTSGSALVSLASSTTDAQLVSIAVPQALSTTSTPTFAGENLTTGQQFNGITSKIFVAADFTTSGVGTNSEAITGLTYTLPATTALSVGVHCSGTYLQNTGNAAATLSVGFSAAPTNAQFQGIAETAVTAVGVLGSTAITSATTGAVVTMTPGGTATNYYFSIDGFIENPSTTANVVTFYARTATAADTITIRRGSYCALQF